MGAEVYDIITYLLLKQSHNNYSVIKRLSPLISLNLNLNYFDVPLLDMIKEAYEISDQENKYHAFRKNI